MIRVLLLPLLFLLVACATPQEACVSRETRDLRVLDTLIARDSATLERGYALAEETRWQPTLTFCSGSSFGGHSHHGFGTTACFRPEPRTRTVPVAVDLDDVQARLDGLLEKRAELSARAEAGVSACRSLFPEG